VALAEHPAVAPLADRGDRRDQILAHRGQLVLVTRAVHARVDPHQHAVLDQVLETRRQHVARDRQVLGELREPAHAEERLAHHQQRPPVAQDLERSGDRTVVAGEPMAHEI
jgi:hypothetical protein